MIYITIDMIADIIYVKKNYKQKKIKIYSLEKTVGDRVFKTTNVFLKTNKLIDDKYFELTRNLNMAKLNVLLIVNPVSGNGKGKNIYHKIKPIIKLLKWNVFCAFTKYKGHATKIVKTFNHENYPINKIIAVGGDGLVNEICSGLLDKNLSDIPIGIIPAGSGNGLIKSSLYESGESYSVMCALYQIIKGREKRLDVAIVLIDELYQYPTQMHNESPYSNELVEIDKSDEQDNTYDEKNNSSDEFEQISINGTENKKNKMYSVLSMSWAITSDVDIGSESMRFLGSTRFTFSALYNILKLNTYKGKISYLPFPRRSNMKWNVLEGEFIMLWVCNVSHMAHDMHNVPGSKLNDGHFNIMILRKGVSRWKLLQLFLGMEKGEHVKDKTMEIYKATAYTFEPEELKGIVAIDGERVETSKISSHIENGLLKIY